MKEETFKEIFSIGFHMGLNVDQCHINDNLFHRFAIDMEHEIMTHHLEEFKTKVKRVYDQYIQENDHGHS